MGVKQTKEAVLVLRNASGGVIGVVITIPGSGHIFFETTKMGMDDIANLFESGRVNNNNNHESQ